MSDAREAPCTACGSDWHYTDEHATGDLPPGAYLASALEAANIPCDSGEDVDRLIAELAKRGWALARVAALSEAEADYPEESRRFIPPFEGGFREGARWALNRWRTALSGKGETPPPRVK